MNTSLFSTVYAATLHICAVVAIVVLLALGKVDQTSGFSILAGLLGFAVGVPVSVTGSKGAGPPS